MGAHYTPERIAHGKIRYHTGWGPPESGSDTGAWESPPWVWLLQSWEPASQARRKGQHEPTEG